MKNSEDITKIKYYPQFKIFEDYKKIVEEKKTEHESGNKKRQSKPSE